MPRIDGKAVAAAVKSMRPTTSVILLTGSGPHPPDDDENPVNVDRVLSKPTRLANIRASIAELAG